MNIHFDHFVMWPVCVCLLSKTTRSESLTHRLFPAPLRPFKGMRRGKEGESTPVRGMLLVPIEHDECT